MEKEIFIETYNRETPSKISKINKGSLFWVKGTFYNKKVLYPVICTGRSYVQNLKRFFLEGYYIRSDQKAAIFEKEDVITKHNIQKYINEGYVIFTDKDYEEELKNRIEEKKNFLHERIKNIKEI